MLVDWENADQDAWRDPRHPRAYADETTIIILTAYTWDDIAEEAAGPGVDAYVQALFASTC